MPTWITFGGGTALLVAQELADVVETLAGHTADTPALPEFTRRAGDGDPDGVDGQPVHVRPSQILFVTPA